MELIYCETCKKWLGGEEFVNVTRFSGVGTIDPPDLVFMCDRCETRYDEDYLEDNTCDEDNILDLLNSAGVTP